MIKIIFVVVFSLCFAGSADQLFAGEVNRISFVNSKNASQDALYRIVLPDSYNSSNKSYPVIYILHGKNTQFESARFEQNFVGSVIAAYKDAVAANEIEEAILVFYYGGNISTFYGNVWPQPICDGNCTEKGVAKVDGRNYGAFK